MTLFVLFLFASEANALFVDNGLTRWRKVLFKRIRTYLLFVIFCTIAIIWGQEIFHWKLFKSCLVTKLCAKFYTAWKAVFCVPIKKPYTWPIFLHYQWLWWLWQIWGVNIYTMQLLFENHLLFRLKSTPRDCQFFLDNWLRMGTDLFGRRRRTRLS